MNTNDVSFVRKGETLFEFSFQPEQQLIIPRENETIRLDGFARSFIVRSVTYEYVTYENSFQGTVVTIYVDDWN